MKIKTQFNLLILSVLVIPFTSLVILYYVTINRSPKKYLLKGYEEIHKISNYNISESKWKEIEKILIELPPEIEILILYDNTIIYTTFPEFENGNSCTRDEMYDFINSTSIQYDYQFHRSVFNTSEENNINTYGVIISRSSSIEIDNHKKRFEIVKAVVLISSLIFEFVVIISVILIFNSISSSILVLEQETKRIAEGKLDTGILPQNQTIKFNEITSLLENLEKMRVSLQDNETRRSRFIMGMSHDLRTPVALIKGYTEAISDGVIDDMDSLKKSLEIIHKKSEQLEDMINDLISYVKLESTEWRATMNYVNLYDFLNDFSQQVYLAASPFKRKVIIDIDIPQDIMIKMDTKLVNRSLENLFSNGIRYTKDFDTISFIAKQENNEIKLMIADNGIGMEKEDLERLFDLFYRGTNSRREQGSGIGLSVVKSVVTAMNWQITVDSEKGKGSCFTITIPISAE